MAIRFRNIMPWAYFVICKGLAYMKLIALLKNIGFLSVMKGIEQISDILFLHQQESKLLPAYFWGRGEMDYWVEWTDSQI